MLLSDSFHKDKEKPFLNWISISEFIYIFFFSTLFENQIILHFLQKDVTKQRFMDQRTIFLSNNMPIDFINPLQTPLKSQSYFRKNKMISFELYFDVINGFARINTNYDCLYYSPYYGSVTEPCNKKLVKMVICETFFGCFLQI